MRREEHPENRRRKRVLGLATMAQFWLTAPLIDGEPVIEK
jgi:hypothetical protein